MIDYWVAFAKSGTPTAEGAAVWRAYVANRSYMAFRGQPEASAQLLPGAYALHEEVVARRRHAGGLPWRANIGIAAEPLPPAIHETN